MALNEILDENRTFFTTIFFFSFGYELVINQINNQMQTTIQELNKRITNLELIVNQIDEGDDTLTTNIKRLKEKLSQVYQSHPDLKKLNQLNTKLKIWDKVTPSTKKEDGISEEVKLETIDLLSSDILETYPTIMELLNNQYVSTIKGINNLIMAKDVQTNMETLMSKKDQLERINRIYQVLNVKSMIIVEKYVELTLKDNKFWIDLEKQLEMLNQKITHTEELKRGINKY